jgi:hypothetical protein
MLTRPNSNRFTMIIEVFNKWNIGQCIYLSLEHTAAAYSFLFLTLENQVMYCRWCSRQKVWSQLCPMCCAKEAGVQRISAQPRPCVESCGVEMCPSSTQATHSPPPKPLTPLHPSSYRFGPLAALQRDGTEWCTPIEFVISQICDQWMRKSVCKYCHLYYDGTRGFLSSII